MECSTSQLRQQTPDLRHATQEDEDAVRRLLNSFAENGKSSTYFPSVLACLATDRDHLTMRPILMLPQIAVRWLLDPATSQVDATDLWEILRQVKATILVFTSEPLSYGASYRLMMYKLIEVIILAQSLQRGASFPDLVNGRPFREDIPDLALQSFTDESVELLSWLARLLVYPTMPTWERTAVLNCYFSVIKKRHMTFPAPFVPVLDCLELVQGDRKLSKTDIRCIQKCMLTGVVSVLATSRADCRASRLNDNLGNGSGAFLSILQHAVGKPLPLLDTAVGGNQAVPQRDTTAPTPKDVHWKRLNLKTKSVDTSDCGLRRREDINEKAPVWFNVQDPRQRSKKHAEPVSAEMKSDFVMPTGPIRIISESTARAEPPVRPVIVPLLSVPVEAAETKVLIRQMDNRRGLLLPRVTPTKHADVSSPHHTEPAPPVACQWSKPRSPSPDPAEPGSLAASLRRLVTAEPLSDDIMPEIKDVTHSPYRESNNPPLSREHFGGRKRRLSHDDDADSTGMNRSRTRRTLLPTPGTTGHKKQPLMPSPGIDRRRLHTGPTQRPGHFAGQMQHQDLMDTRAFYSQATRKHFGSIPDGRPRRHGNANHHWRESDDVFEGGPRSAGSHTVFSRLG